MNKQVSKHSARPKVSVVVPIYNVEKYLRECVDSILAQTLKDIEVILVDDGSPDKCGEIIDQYAKKDPRVIAVHQKNSGYSIAVNKGIDLAKGEYIGIIESDDWIEPDMYEQLYEDAKKNKTDVTKGMFYIYNSTSDEGMRDIVYKNPSGVDLRYAPSGPFSLSDWPKLIAFHASIWSSIYRADFVKAIKIPDTAGASYQDFPFMVETLCRAKRISVVKKPFVHWRNDPNQGNSTSATGKKLLLMAENSQTAVKIAKDLKMWDDVKEALTVHLIWANLAFFYTIDSKYKREYYEILHRLFTPIKADKSIKYQYFSEPDMKFFELMNRPNYASVALRMNGARFKHGLMRVMTCILLTYRTVTFIKDQNNIIMSQMRTMEEQISDLKSIIKKKQL